MRADFYGNPFQSASKTARNAYVEGQIAVLETLPRVKAGFDRASAADEGFALAHAAKARHESPGVQWPHIRIRAQTSIKTSMLLEVGSGAERRGFSRRQGHRQKAAANHICHQALLAETLFRIFEASRAETGGFYLRVWPGLGLV